MGTWDVGLYDSDDVMDAGDDFYAAIESGKSPAEAAEIALREYEECSSYVNSLRLAFASLLLDAGVRAHPLFEEARRIIRSGADLRDWRDGGASDETLAQRKAVLDQFLRRLPTPS